MGTLKTIFSYEDYRTFLADYYETKKAEDAPFSYRLFSTKAGFGNKGFLYNVIQGRRNLSKPSIVRLAQAMELTRPEANYFEDMVFFGQAKNFRDREHFFNRMSTARVKSPEGITAKKLREDQFTYFSDWYNVVIRSVIELCPFASDFKWLAKMVRPNITPKQAQEAVELLERLGLIEKTQDGVYRLLDKTVTTGPQVVSLAVQRFHLDMMDRAAEAVRNLPKEKRNVSALTVGISKESYAKICELILACQNEILDVARQDDKADQVYQINFHFFPISFPIGGVKGECNEAVSSL